MLRVFCLVLITLAAANPARAAGDIDACRKQDAEPAARLAACETVIADDKITGKPRAGACSSERSAPSSRRGASSRTC